MVSHCDRRTAVKYHKEVFHGATIVIKEVVHRDTIVIFERGAMVFERGSECGMEVCGKLGFLLLFLLSPTLPPPTNSNFATIIISVLGAVGMSIPGKHMLGG